MQPEPYYPVLLSRRELVLLIAALEQFANMMHPRTEAAEAEQLAGELQEVEPLFIPPEAMNGGGVFG